MKCKFVPIITVALERIWRTYSVQTTVYARMYFNSIVIFTIYSLQEVEIIIIIICHKKVYMRRHDWIGKTICWKVCCKFGFNVKEKWYKYQPDAVVENVKQDITIFLRLDRLCH